ncbi:MAG TPA: nuclear transport factor 2 family protein [Thermoanaerobaculia bacterium]|nr:nuclear transport factor 2 family protein [Thermoanaerobaculia bacterium]
MAQGLGSEGDLAERETERLAAVVLGDRARLADFYDDAFVDLSATGERLSKDQLIEILLRLPPGRRYDQEDRHFERWGESAVVTGLLVVREAEAVVGRFRFLHVWRRQEAGWLLVAGMSAPLAAPGSR